MKTECVYCAVGTEKLKMYLKEAQDYIKWMEYANFLRNVSNAFEHQQDLDLHNAKTRKFVFCSQNLFMCFG